MQKHWWLFINSHTHTHTHIYTHTHTHTHTAGYVVQIHAKTKHQAITWCTKSKTAAKYFSLSTYLGLPIKTMQMSRFIYNYITTGTASMLRQGFCACTGEMRWSAVPRHHWVTGWKQYLLWDSWSAQSGRWCWGSAARNKWVSRWRQTWIRIVPTHHHHHQTARTHRWTPINLTPAITHKLS